jgi:hypothetical protein
MRRIALLLGLALLVCEPVWSQVIPLGGRRAL